MTETEETAYTQGQRAAWQQMLNESLRQLGYDDPAANAARWASEREAAIQSLRSLCREKGDNKWDESLHLQDIIEKHLADHLLGYDDESSSPDWRSIADDLAAALEKLDALYRSEQDPEAPMNRPEWLRHPWQRYHRALADSANAPHEPRGANH